MKDTFLMFYQVVGSLGLNGGPWDVEMRGELSPKVGNGHRGIYSRTKESVLGGFLLNEGYKIHYECTLEVLSSGGVTESKGWSMRC